MMSSHMEMQSSQRRDSSIVAVLYNEMIII